VTRGLTGDALAALTAAEVRIALFFEGQFPGGAVRLWTGLGPMLWNGETWAGAGTLIGVSEIEDGARVEAAGLSVTLSGVPADLVQTVIAEAQQGLPGRVWIAFLTPEGEIIADPVLAFAGRLDVPEIRDAADSCLITVSYESRLIDLNRPREWRYTQESQAVSFPGDRGFEYVTAIQAQDIVWGR
jgi:hypothetical protein